MKPGSGAITDAGIASLEQQIGVEHEAFPWNSAATYDAVWHFAFGVGDDNPLWWDPAHPADEYWGGRIVPPAFLYSCYRGGPRAGRPPSGQAEFDSLPGVVGLWSRDRWTWHRPTFIGEEIRATTGVEAVVVRSDSNGSRTVDLTHKVVFSAKDSSPLAELRSQVTFLDGDSHLASKRYEDTPPGTYSEHEQREIAEQYEREPGQRRGSLPLWWEEVPAGSELITILKGPLTMTNLIGWKQGWGSSLCSTNRIAFQNLRSNPGARLYDPATGIEDSIAAVHWEPVYLSSEGMPRGYDYGAQRISWFAHLLTDWCGDLGFVAGLDVRLVRPNFFGDCTWLSGRVTAKHQDGVPSGLLDSVDDRAYGTVECELQATNQRGEVTAAGTAAVALPRRDPGAGVLNRPRPE